MPSGGTTSLRDLDPRAWRYVRKCFEQAAEFGLGCEVLDWTLGGMVQGKSPIEATSAALIEWDIDPPPFDPVDKDRTKEY